MVVCSRVRAMGCILLRVGCRLLVFAQAYDGGWAKQQVGIEPLRRGPWSTLARRVFILAKDDGLRCDKQSRILFAVSSTRSSCAVRGLIRLLYAGARICPALSFILAVEENVMLYFFGSKAGARSSTETCWRVASVRGLCHGGHAAKDTFIGDLDLGDQGRFRR